MFVSQYAILQKLIRLKFAKVKCYNFFPNHFALLVYSEKRTELKKAEKSPANWISYAPFTRSPIRRISSV